MRAMQRTSGAPYCAPPRTVSKRVVLVLSLRCRGWLWPPSAGPQEAVRRPHLTVLAKCRSVCSNTLGTECAKNTLSDVCVDLKPQVTQDLAGGLQSQIARLLIPIDAWRWR
jgi:hypothetical protein